MTGKAIVRGASAFLFLALPCAAAENLPAGSLRAKPADRSFAAIFPAKLRARPARGVKLAGASWSTDFRKSDLSGADLRSNAKWGFHQATMKGPTCATRISSARCSTKPICPVPTSPVPTSSVPT